MISQNVPQTHPSPFRLMPDPSMFNSENDRLNTKFLHPKLSPNVPKDYSFDSKATGSRDYDLSTNKPQDFFDAILRANPIPNYSESQFQKGSRLANSDGRYQSLEGGLLKRVKTEHPESQEHSESQNSISSWQYTYPNHHMISQHSTSQVKFPTQQSFTFSVN